MDFDEGVNPRLAGFGRRRKDRFTKPLLAPGGLIYDLKGVLPPAASDARI